MLHRLTFPLCITLLLQLTPTTNLIAQYSIAIHGGAGSSGKNLTEKERQLQRESMTKALTIGKEILSQGGTSLDAVEAVIRHMEDDPQFNSGKGAVFNAVGKHELDSSIMDGSTKACGAVAGVTIVKNPISLARKVMTQTRHVLLSGPGADQFAKEMEVDLVENEYFSTDKRHNAWLRANRANSQLVPKDPVGDLHYGTVGCVALDQHGNLAAGTSTGGLTNKKFGRIGDSPIVGAGTYADNKTCAVSCTGIGEHFIRNAVAYDVSALMAYKGISVKDAVQFILQKKLTPNDGGIIAVAANGDISMDFNTEGMARAAASSQGRFEILIGDEKESRQKK